MCFFSSKSPEPAPPPAAPPSANPVMTNIYDPSTPRKWRSSGKRVSYE